MSTELPRLTDKDLTGKVVILRAEVNAPMTDGEITDDARLQIVVSALKLCREKGAKKVVILGKLGRPEGGYDKELSLIHLIEYFKDKLGEDIAFVDYKPIEQFDEVIGGIKNTYQKFVLVENIRFWSQEGENDENFARALAECGDIYVNEAFGVSHRDEASIVGIPKFIDKAAGEQFVHEYENLSKVLDNPKRPVVTFLSGAKEDKLDYLDDFIRISDKVLVAGLLPTILGEDYASEKVVVGKLIQDKEDITKRTMEQFVSIVSNAGAIVVSGPMGKFEDPGHLQGTKEVFEAIAESSAYKVAGGGDTGHAIRQLGLEDKFDFISTAGGAMLEFLAKGTLPGIEALVH